MENRPVLELKAHLNGDDAQALYQAKQRYDALSKVAAQLVTITGPDGGWLGDQADWEAFTGEAGYEGFGWVRAIHPDDVDQTVGHWNKSISTGEPFQAEFRLRRKDGSYRALSMSITP